MDDNYYENEKEENRGDLDEGNLQSYEHNQGVFFEKRSPESQTESRSDLIFLDDGYK